MKAAVWLFCACALGGQTVTVTGSVTSAITHEPIESVSVLLHSIRPTLGVNSDASGRFHIPEVKAGTYWLIPSRAGFEGAAREIRIEGGADPPPFDLTMMPWPGLRGRVLDLERQAVARVRVRAINIEGSAQRPGDYYAFVLRGSFNADEMHNPAYARRYLDSATSVRLERNSTATLTLLYVKVASSQ